MEPCLEPALGRVHRVKLAIFPVCPPLRNSQGLTDMASGATLCGVIYASEYPLLPHPLQPRLDLTGDHIPA